MTNDPGRNVKEQERLGAEIASLQEQLAAVQHDHTVLVERAAGGVTQAPAAPAAEAKGAAVPSPRQKTGAARGGKRKARKSTAAPQLIGEPVLQLAAAEPVGVSRDAQQSAPVGPAEERTESPAEKPTRASNSMTWRVQAFATRMTAHSDTPPSATP
ncbi:hypothetical protein [Streptomyces sp. NPDC056464]|uniref:hypothetical protein n=1 Tax=Streptomyces sp. NPDC056464 TaxID=3345828 RepID=UPI0036A79EBE